MANILSSTVTCLDIDGSYETLATRGAEREKRVFDFGCCLDDWDGWVCTLN